MTMTALDVLAVAEQTEAHAHAVAIVLQLQGGLDRQRRILYLRAELERLAANAENVRSELKTAEAEQQLERDLTSEMIARFDRAASFQESRP